MIQTGNEALLKEWGELGVVSTYFMGKIIGYEDLADGLHWEMAKWIQSSHKRKVGVAPRDHLKTSVWTIADTMRVISGSEDERILIRSSTTPNAVNLVHKIKDIAESNTLWRRLYPKRVPDGKGRWRDDALDFPRKNEYPEASIEAMGMETTLASRHYTRVKDDDPVGESAENSALIMEEAIRKIKLTEHLLVDPSTSTHEVYGTRWGNKDVIHSLLSSTTHWQENPVAAGLIDARWGQGTIGEYSVMLLGCYGPVGTRGEPIWPERFNREVLEQIRRRVGIRQFALQMLNDPVAGGDSELKREWLKPASVFEKNNEWWVELTDRATYPLDACSVYEAIDPNITPDSRHSRSAVVTVCITPADPYDMVVLGCKAKPSTTYQALEVGWEEWQRWRPLVCGVEVVAGFRGIIEFVLKTYPRMGWQWIRPNPHKSKLQRIRQLAPLAENGRLYALQTREMQDLYEEWESFPPGPSGTLDCLDALAYAVSISAPPPPQEVISDERYDDRPVVIPDDESRSPITGY
jgi:hypothetical protein